MTNLAEPRTGRDAARPSIRRLLGLVALCLALLAQGAYSFQVNPEPYPAVRMPAFADVPDSAGRFPTTTVDLTIDFADGSRLQPNVAELMAEFRSTARKGSLRHVFAPERNRANPRPADDPGVRTWLAQRARQLGAGREPRAIEFCWRRSDLDVRAAAPVDPPACDVVRVSL